MFRLVLAVLALFAFANGRNTGSSFSSRHFVFHSAENCEAPQFKVVSHSTRDARLTAESAAQLEITVNCKSGKQVRGLFVLSKDEIFHLAKYTLCRHQWTSCSLCPIDFITWKILCKKGYLVAN